MTCTFLVDIWVGVSQQALKILNVASFSPKWSLVIQRSVYQDKSVCRAPTHGCDCGAVDDMGQSIHHMAPSVNRRFGKVWIHFGNKPGTSSPQGDDLQFYCHPGTNPGKNYHCGSVSTDKLFIIIKSLITGEMW